MAKRDNEEKLKSYLKEQGQITDTVKPVERRPGRPVTRVARPERSAAKRTHPGEERYLVTLKTSDIQSMKDIAAADGDTIKEAFANAIADYIAKH